MSMKHLSPLLADGLGHFIGGRYVDGGSRFTVIAPATDQVLADIPAGGAQEVALAVESAKSALNGAWGKSLPSERARVLRKIGDGILANLNHFARLESLDTGKPLSETSTGDIPRAAQNFHVFADLCAHQVSPSYFTDDGTQHTTMREPLGIVGLITPWNLPLYLATWKLAPALAQGNAVILKPAELTPLTAMALGKIMHDAGVPAGVVNVVQGFGPDAAGEALVKHPDVKALSFTGETTTGEAIMRTAASSLKKLSFELGGKGATVIFADADLKKSGTTAARAAFRNQGQICLAGSRLLVQTKALDEVMEHLLGAVRAIRVGDPLAADTTMGSLIAKSHRDKVAGFVEHARTLNGIEIIAGGRIPPAFAQQGAFYEPTVITGVAQNSRLIQEEIFGPVLTVQTFDTEDEALALLNDTPYGLSCSVFTRDIGRAQRMARQAKMGLVWINGWFLRDLHTAFGGMKRSGVGREGGQLSLDFFSEMKTISMAVE